VNRPTFQMSWNPKRREITYRIGKQGTSAFLLFGADDIAELHRLITQAMKGTANDRTAGLTEDEFVQLVSEAHFAYEFATEKGRGRLRPSGISAEQGVG
jgi:hypothetical protein